MNYEENFYKSMLFNSLNPFVLFNKEGKLIDYNKEAEFLFNDVAPKELYSLALSYAPHSFGFLHSFLDLQYGKDKYYAIVVGYIDEEFVGLELYKLVGTSKKLLKSADIEPVNLYSLLEISKATILGPLDIELEEIYDTSLPEIKVNINSFLVALNEYFSLFKNEKKLTIKVHLKIGEYEILDGKKYSIIVIETITKNSLNVTNLEVIGEGACINVIQAQKSIQFEFPMILD